MFPPCCCSTQTLSHVTQNDRDNYNHCICVAVVVCYFPSHPSGKISVRAADADETDYSVRLVTAFLESLDLTCTLLLAGSRTPTDA